MTSIITLLFLDLCGASAENFRFWLFCTFGGKKMKNSGVLLEYPTTTGFQWGHLKNGPYTYTVSGANGRVF